MALLKDRFPDSPVVGEGQPLTTRVAEARSYLSFRQPSVEALDYFLAGGACRRAGTWTLPISMRPAGR